MAPEELQLPGACQQPSPPDPSMARFRGLSSAGDQDGLLEPSAVASMCNALRGTQPHTATRIAEGPLREGQEDGDVRDIRRASCGLGKKPGRSTHGQQRNLPLVPYPSVCY